MNIAFLQRVSLQDFPDTISCIVFLSGCSFRCGMCYNAMILDSNYKGMDEEEFFKFLDSRKNRLEGVVISGGEPLMHKEILEFLQKIRDKGMKIKIDTNGSFPERLQDVIDAGLVDYVAMDIKASREDYEKVAGVKIDIEAIEESMRILKDARKKGIEHEFRTTLCPIVDGKNVREMDERDIERIADWIASIDSDARYYVQPFMPQEGRLLNKELEKGRKTRFETLEKAKQRAERFLKRVQIRD